MINKSLLDKSRRSTAFVLPTVMLTKVFGILYVLLLTRGLSIEQYGTYNFFIGLITVFAFLCNFGLQSTLQRFIPKYSVNSEWARLLNLVTFAHIFRFVLSVVFLLLAYVFYEYWAIKFGVEEYRNVYVAFAIGAFLLFQIMYFSTEFNALMMHGTTSIIELVMSSLKILVVYGVLTSGFGLIWIFISELLAYAIAFLYATYRFILYVYKPIKDHADQGPKKNEVGRLLRFSSFNAVVAPGAIMFSHSMDVFIIAAMATQYELGLYALASRASAMILSIMPHNLLQGVIRPVFYHRYSESAESNKELALMFQSLLVLAACVIIPAVMIVGVVSDPLIQNVFGDKYSESVNIFIVLIAFNIFTIVEMPSDLVLRAIEKVDAVLYAQIFAIYNVVAAILLMPHYGLMGVAFATGSALMFKCVFLYYMVYRHTKVVVPWIPIMKILINSGVSASVAYAVIDSSLSAFNLMLALISSGVIYFLMTYVNNFMNDYTKGLVNKFVKRKIFQI